VKDIMKRTRFIAATVAAIAISGLGVGLGLGFSAPAGAAIARTAAAARPLADAGTTPKPYIVALDCLGKPDVRPASYTFACADGNDYLSKTMWTSWTMKLASGYGTEVINDCIPNCAAGHYISYPALVVFWGRAAVSGHKGEFGYTHYTVIYPGKRPPAYKNGKPVPGPVTKTYPLPF
jgi:hypothetical protein